MLKIKLFKNVKIKSAFLWIKALVHGSNFMYAFEICVYQLFENKCPETIRLHLNACTE